MSGTCTATITISAAYREATLISCAPPSAPPIAGTPFSITIVVAQGSVAENYKLVFSGDYVGETTPFLVSAGAGQITLSAGPITIPVAGTKNITAALVKV